MRISRAEKEKLREKILLRAIPSLKTWGRDGAPVDKIMKELGLTSGALYSHFKSKDDFFAQVVLRELDRLQEIYTQMVDEHGNQAASRLVEIYLSDAHIPAVDKGCVFVALGADMHRHKPAVRALFEEKIQAIFQTLAEGIAGPNPAARLAKVRFLFSSMVGTITFSRSMKEKESSKAFLQSNKKQLLEFLKG